MRVQEVCHTVKSLRGRLLLLEAVLPEWAADNPAAIRMDLYMLLLLPDRERTTAEFSAMLQKAGFRLTRMILTASNGGANVMEAGWETN